MTLVAGPSDVREHERLPVRQVFGVFLRLGAGAFGGPAMVPFIKRRVVDQLRWLSEVEFREGLALCQVVPGATTMQLAGWVGLKVGGITRAAVAFIAFGIPAVVLMVAMSAGYLRWGRTGLVVAVFAGLQAVVVSILATATLMFGRASIRTWRNIAIGCGASALFTIEVHPLWVVLASATVAALLGPDNATARPGQCADPTRHVGPILGVLAVAGLGMAVLAVASPALAELGLLMGRIDLFAFGGGFASLPLMYHEVLARHWMSSSTFLDGIALGQITPGPVVITATFVGYVVDGVSGAIIATIGIFLPSFVILVAVAPRIGRLRHLRRFDAVIAGLSAAFVGLLAVATVRLALEVPWDLPRAAIAATAFAGLIAGVEVVWIVIAAASVAALILR